MLAILSQGKSNILNYSAVAEDFMQQVLPTLCVAIAIVQIGEKFVFVQEAKEICRGKWSLPGGLVEVGEGIDQAVRREVIEETGLVVNPLGVLRIEQIQNSSPKELFRQKIRFIVIADAISGNLKSVEDLESIQAKLFSFDEISRLDLREPRCVQWIKQAQDRAPFLPISHFSFTAPPAV